MSIVALAGKPVFRKGLIAAAADTGTLNSWEIDFRSP